MTPEQLKKQAADAALMDIQSGMKVGIGTGSTVYFLILALGEALRRGRLKDISTVPTSQSTESLLIQEQIPMLSSFSKLDLAIDGADEVDENLSVIKGGGGALLREKIVAEASQKFVVIVDEGKFKPLGAFPLPVEVLPFGHEATALQLMDVCRKYGFEPPFLRKREGAVFYSDNGNVIYDLPCGRIENPYALKAELEGIAGVMAQGLFLDMVDKVYISSKNGVTERHKKGTIIA